MLTANNLSMVYPDGESNRVIFEHLSLTIAPAERVAIVGPSGSGKSTLLYLLSGLRKPTSGQVFLDDKEITAMDDSSEVRMKNFGFVFQQHYLIPYLSVLKNVLTGLPEKPGKEQVEQAMALLAELELTKEFNKLPHQLSGGQKQRVAIARALIRRPKIIFADEPTASLDKKTAIEVMDILRRQKDVTLVYNTHDLSLIKCTDRIIEIGKSNGVMSIER